LTGPSHPAGFDGETRPDEAAADETAEVEASESEPIPPARPIRPSLFGLEGRRVPALYTVGWIFSLMGVATLFVSVMAAGNGAARWLFLVGLVVLALGLLAATGSQAVERSSWEELAYRGPSPVLAFGPVVVLTLLALFVVLAPLSAMGLDASSPVATLLSLGITALLYYAVVRLFVVGQGALSWADMGLGAGPMAAARELLIGVVLAAPVVVVTLLLAALLGRFLVPAPSALPAATDGLSLVVNLVAAAVLAPLGEELFFRGFATAAWARAIGVRGAIIRGALFFAAAHVLTLFDASFGDGAQRALFAFLGLLPVSVALGWIFLSRRSLWAAIGLHAGFNGIQVILLFLATRAG
jgi:membrane protease YdiL (CAAX protease family)